MKTIIINATDELKVIPQLTFKQCFQKWIRRWERCIAKQGDCFKGDNIQYALRKERYNLETYFWNLMNAQVEREGSNVCSADHINE